MWRSIFRQRLKGHGHAENSISTMLSTRRPLSGLTIPQGEPFQGRVPTVSLGLRLVRLEVREQIPAIDSTDVSTIEPLYSRPVEDCRSLLAKEPAKMRICPSGLNGSAGRACHSNGNTQVSENLFYAKVATTVTWQSFRKLP